MSENQATGSGSITLSLSDDLTAIEDLSGIGDVEDTGTNTWGSYNLSAAGKALLDDADSAANKIANSL